MDYIKKVEIFTISFSKQYMICKKRYYRINNFSLLKKKAKIKEQKREDDEQVMT